MRRRDLIVPIHDRRKGRRILTLRNFGIAMAVCFVAFIAITLHSEMRGRGPNEYARYERKPATPPKPKPVEVVQEEEVAPVTPLYVGSAPLPPAIPEYTPPPATIPANAAQEGDVKLVGGPEGVTIVRQKRERPVLSGGFGRE